MKNPAVDAYLAKAAPFARPILERIRRLVHRACPRVEEKLKWGVPSYEQDGMLAMTAAFRAHVRFIFWRGKELPLPAPLRDKKLASAAELPPDRVLLDLLRRAAALNAAGPRPASARSSKPPLKVPGYLLDALRRVPKAKAAFDAFPPSCRREYVDWIVEAKQEATRARRLSTAVDWLSKGRRMNWKYERRAKGRDPRPT